MKEPDSKFLICECSEHGLLIEKFEDEEEVCISLFERGLKGRTLSFSERLRWCWHILRCGRPWSDYIILNKENTEKLAKFIKSI